MRQRLTFSNIVSVLALFVALSGGAYAAAVLPKNSVGTSQLKKNAVVSSKVKNGSLLVRDFKRGQLPRGAKGATGPQGPAGAAGAPGPKGDKGDTGASGTVSSLNDLDGAPCARQSVQGTISLTYAADGTATLKCVLPADYTTLAAPANGGDTNIKVASVTGMVAGNTITVDPTGANPETVTLMSVGTAGSGGTGVTFTPSLTFPHASGALVHRN